MIQAAATAEAQNAAYWATISNEIKLQKGIYSFKDREYLLEPMSSTFRRRCFLKGSQGGQSTSEVLKSIHGMRFGHFPLGVLYLFPTDTDMQAYSKGVVAPLITANYQVIGKHIKKKSSNSADLKAIGKSNFYLRSGNLAQIIEGEGESPALKGISVDKVVFDEIELMDKEAIGKAIGRMGNSEVNEEVYIGNPGIPGRGIDEIFRGSDEFPGSDQRHWFRKCLKCGEWTCAEETFPECVKIRPDGTGYIGCMKCGERVFVRDGQWVAKYPEKSNYLHGYRWSHLTTPNNDPAEVLEQFLNPLFGNLGDVYRLRLGEAYVSSEERLSIGQVLSHCKHHVMSSKDDGPCAFGLDVGKICHLVIGKRIGSDRYEIIFVGRFPGDGNWGEIEAVLDRANCKSGVIDARPYENAARQFQKRNKYMRIFLCEYSETTPIGKSFNKKTGMVKVNRTEICDDTHDLVSDDDRLVLPRLCPEMHEFAKQVCDPAKKMEINKKTKLAIYRYQGRNDHYRHALNYFLLAAHKTARASSSGTRNKKHRMCNNDYARI